VAESSTKHFACLLFCLQDTILFGCDDFDTAENRKEDQAAGTVPLGIGKGSRITRAIIDRNARIGCNVVLTNKEGLVDGSKASLPPGVMIRDGILVVLRDAVIPDGTEV
jgi:glucose-1-phosphate adenylyltransferase